MKANSSLPLRVCQYRLRPFATDKDSSFIPEAKHVHTAPATREEFYEPRREASALRAKSRSGAGDDPFGRVFAIVITLLVLEIQVPDLTGGQQLADALGEIWPSLVAFLISFVVVAIAWTGHRDLFAFIRLTDRNLV